MLPTFFFLKSARRCSDSVKRPSSSRISSSRKRCADSWPLRLLPSVCSTKLFSSVSTSASEIWRLGSWNEMRYRPSVSELPARTAFTTKMCFCRESSSSSISSGVLARRCRSVLRDTASSCGRLSSACRTIETSDSTFGSRARPCNSGPSAVLESTYTRAVASYTLGSVNTNAQPPTQTTQAASSATQRKRQLPRSSSRIRMMIACMCVVFRSEERLWNDDHIARFQILVLDHLSLLDQRFQLDLDLDGLAGLVLANDLRTIARRELGQASHCENRVQGGEALAERHRLRIRHLPDHFHLTEGADRIRDDYVYLRRAHVFGE